MSQSKTPSKPRPATGNSQAQQDKQLIYEQVEHVIRRIRPAVQSDGGDVELVEITPENIVRVRLHGNCVGCPSSSMTLHMGIERNIRERVPQIVGVEQVK